MSNIKIAVACHKPSVLPENELFIPIQVGASIASKRIPNIEHDDNGKNISGKNASYCELTAQYWSWKNLDADYYGLCHYRRFLLFKDVENCEYNERNQVEAYAINDFNIKKYGLNDENEMRNIIEQYDVVCGPLQDVSNLYTPRGIKTTAWEHWTAHDRALISIKDLDCMMSIFEDVAPDVARSAREYMSGGKFLGFNCFVMKKELFFTLCEIEFEILRRLEEKVDLSNYNQQLKRIYGFMGEIIISSYIYHLEKQKKYRIKHIPLLYFNYTDIPSKLDVNKEAIPVIFVHEENNFLFGTVLQSFIDTMNISTKYNLFVCLFDLNLDLKQMYLNMVNRFENIKLQFIDLNYIKNDIIDKYRLSVKTLELEKNRSEDALFFPTLPFIPFYIKECDRAVVLSENIILKKPIDELWDVMDDEEKYLSAAYDVHMISRYNDIYEETEKTYLDTQLENPFSYFSTSVLVFNFSKYRLGVSIENIVYKIFANNGKYRKKSEIINMICEQKINRLSQKWNVIYPDNGYLKYQLPYAPDEIYKELLAAQKDPAIITYMPNDPWMPEANRIYIEFWSVARKTVLYERYLAYMMNILKKKNSKKNDVLDKIFPKGGELRKVMVKTFPKTSIQRKIIDTIMDRVF